MLNAHECRSPWNFFISLRPCRLSCLASLRGTQLCTTRQKRRCSHTKWVPDTPKQVKKPAPCGYPLRYMSTLKHDRVYYACTYHLPLLTPVHLLIRAIIQSAKHVAAVQCIKSGRCNPRALGNVQIKYQNDVKWDLSDFDSGMVPDTLVWVFQKVWGAENKQHSVSVVSAGWKALLLREIQGEWLEWLN